MRSYAARLEDTLRSRTEIAIDKLRSRVTRDQAAFTAHVHFYDGSQLFTSDESSLAEYRQIVRGEYVFHYQQADGILIFRYDNSPHFPDLPTFPAHEHTPDGVVASPAPDLADVLREIDGFLYPDR